MAIELLAGYAPVFDNAVYSKDKSVSVGDEQVLLKCLVLLKRYAEPTEDQVVEYLRQKADELRGAALLDVPKEARQNRSPLEKAIMELPDNVIRDLKTGDEGCMEFVRSHTDAPAVDLLKEPRNHYLHVRYGLIPAVTIEQNQEAGNIEDASWYDSALSHDSLKESGLGERWNMQLLRHEGVLPDRNEMDILLKHGTHGSRTLEISRINYPCDEVREVMDFIYGKFSTTEQIFIDGRFSKPEQIAQLTDISSDLLEKLALEPVIGLHKMVQNKMAAQELMKKLSEGS